MTTLKLINRRIYTISIIRAFVATLAMIFLFVAMGITRAHAYVELSSQLSLGAKGADVTNLQEFLAASPDIYPQKLVTGYFGSLTMEAVKKFQAKYGISQVGRVGPQTLAKINSLIGGSSSEETNETGTVVMAPSVMLQGTPQVTTTTATFNWVANMPVISRIYYSTYPLQMTEGDINSIGFSVSGGQIGGNDQIMRTSQSLAISNLIPNTTYYYTITLTDAKGNVSVIGPNSTFRTAYQVTGY